ncbi:MAG: DsbA family protein [Candidatus Binatus sp.]|uniref:2-hydroxychromene-2-carboxylate isomerase n=1 Tax=Candidatus Binatus sp. TaxID=2811406 RepID=UPI00272804A0|nr:DsbA family protein [Candidatus Binatus sp.]MDO8432519.1 DsbA family protein [Candidatus Binatus sp.]
MNADDYSVKLYFAYTSPYSYLAIQPAYDLERSHRVRVRFIPYGVNIRKVYGPLDRADADRRKVRYLYIDARRIAKERRLIIYPPKKIYSARLAFYGGLFAEHHGKFRDYSDRVFERFWKHELDVESRDAMSAIVTDVGLDAEEFLQYADSTARADLDACFAEADRDKVFGVPTFVVDGEPFWGEDRVNWVIRKLDQMDLRR